MSTAFCAKPVSGKSGFFPVSRNRFFPVLGFFRWAGCAHESFANESCAGGVKKARLLRELLFTFWPNRTSLGAETNNGVETMLLDDETIHHRGIKIDFHIDDSPVNWWIEGDCQIPCLGPNTDHTGGYDIECPLDDMSDSWITRNRHAIRCELGLDYDDAAFDRMCLQESRDYGIPVADYRRDLFNDAVLEMHKPDRFDALAALWTLRGVPALSTSSQGYSQGDYTDLLFVAHPDWAEKVGADLKAKNWSDRLIAACDEWGAWCWGGVIGYVVDPDGECESCWGFYPSKGSDYFPLSVVHSYCVSEAKSAADRIADERDAAIAQTMIESRPDMYAN